MSSSETTTTTKPPGNTIPPEILQQVFSLLSPRDFDNARHICSQWMRVSLDHRLLESMLKRAGWWDAWQHDCDTGHPSSPSESLVWRMSKRFSTECLLSGRKTNVEKPGFLTTGVVDFSRLALLHSRSRDGGHAEDNEDIPSQFTVSMCGNYVLVTSGYRILVYRLFPRPHGLSDTLSLSLSAAKPRDKDITLVASVVCPDTVLSATVDTSTSRLVVAALLHGRVGMVCDITAHPVSPEDNIQQYHYYHNVCSAEDPPRSIALCPGLGLGRRRCVAFGSTSGIELRWTDESSHQNKKRFPMTQPSEVLHFLPVQSDATPDELRLVSSLAGPGTGTATRTTTATATQTRHQYHHHAHSHREISHPSTKDSVVHATHCHHYRAVPVNDGIHILFIEPQSGFLCIGSDAPIGGPTDLTRALVCTPPFSSPDTSTSTSTASSRDPASDPAIPSVFAAGSDLSWGLRVVAAYNDRLVLYSVPLDVFNVVRKERERQGDDVLAGSDLARDWFLDNHNHHQGHHDEKQGTDGDDDWEFLLAVSYRPTAMLWPLKIYGKEIGRVDDVVELALQSSYGGARVWAFRASGVTDIIDVDTFTSPARSSIAASADTGSGAYPGTEADEDDIPCTSACVDSDGSVESATVVVGRARRRASSTASADSDFKGQFSTPGYVRMAHEDRRLRDSGPASAATTTAETLSKQQPAYAACIVGFNIEEVGC